MAVDPDAELLIDALEARADVLQADLLDLTARVAALESGGTPPPAAGPTAPPGFVLASSGLSPTPTPAEVRAFTLANPRIFWDGDYTFTEPLRAVDHAHWICDGVWTNAGTGNGTSVIWPGSWHPVHLSDVSKVDVVASKGHNSCQMAATPGELYWLSTAATNDAGNFDAPTGAQLNRCIATFGSWAIFEDPFYEDFQKANPANGTGLTDPLGGEVFAVQDFRVENLRCIAPNGGVTQRGGMYNSHIHVAEAEALYGIYGNAFTKSRYVVDKLTAHSRAVEIKMHSHDFVASIGTARLGTPDGGNSPFIAVGENSKDIILSFDDLDATGFSANQLIAVTASADVTILAKKVIAPDIIVSAIQVWSIQQTNQAVTEDIQIVLESAHINGARLLRVEGPATNRVSLSGAVSGSFSAGSVVWLRDGTGHDVSGLMLQQFP